MTKQFVAATPELRDPQLLKQVEQLTRRVIAVWPILNTHEKGKITKTLAEAGVERRKNSWAYQINGQTFLIA